MNQTKKYLGLFAILPLALVALSPDLIGEVDAQKAEGSPGTISPKSYGSATNDRVCGDQLCDTPEENENRSNVGRGQ